MSLARIYTTKTVRKDWKCGKCGAEIKKGVDGRISFAVGFRGYEQTRCMKQECYPTRAERESSALASVYDAVDSADFSSAASLEDLEQIRDDVAAAIREVAEEYESNEMFEINYDLQERADMLNSAADEVEAWEPEDSEPEEDDFDEEDEESEFESFQDQYDAWLDEARASLESAINDAELP